MSPNVPKEQRWCHCSIPMGWCWIQPNLWPMPFFNCFALHFMEVIGKGGKEARNAN